jgi:dUTP pyrophosphatase
MLKFLKVSAYASAPTKSSNSAAGFDLKSAEDIIVKSKQTTLIETGIAIQLPPGTYGRIAPRSGISLHNDILVNAGVIDADYTGTLQIVLYNLSDLDFLVRTGDRVAQLICECCVLPNLVEVHHSYELGQTQRGSSGFGSSGSK